MRSGRALLAIILALSGCAHDLSGNPDRASVVSAVRGYLQTRRICLLFTPGEELPSAPDATSLLAFRQAGGSYTYDPEARRKLDAFVAAGLMTVEERRFDDAEPPFAARHYRRTEAAAGLSSPDFSGPALCYGHAILVRILNVDVYPQRGCLERSVYVDLLYAYEPFPQWVDHPAIAAAFPESVRGADHNLVRSARVNIRPGANGWAYSPPSNGQVMCTGY